MSQMDLLDLLRNRIDATLVTASWVETVKTTLGLEGVSHVWSDTPQWYFWLTAAPGAYHLTLEDARFKTLDGVPMVHGLFSVKCYPYPHERITANFSDAERNLVESHLFDHTGTPRYEEREHIPPGLFQVGAIHLFTTVQDEAAVLSMQAVESMKTLAAAYPGHEDQPMSGERPAKRGPTIRDVPGFELTYPLFDRLVSLHAFYLRRKPVRIIMTSTTGLVAWRLADGRHIVMDTSTSQSLALHVQFPQLHETGPAAGESLILQELSEAEGQTLLDWKQPCECHACCDEAPPASPYVNHQWWTLAETEQKSELGSTCGCH